MSDQMLATKLYIPPPRPGSMVSDSDEVNRFSYVPKDWTDELSSQHSSWGIGQERH